MSEKGGGKQFQSDGIKFKQRPSVGQGCPNMMQEPGKAIGRREVAEIGVIVRVYFKKDLQLTKPDNRPIDNVTAAHFTLQF